jgi:hypothetical protein
MRAENDDRLALERACEQYPDGRPIPGESLIKQEALTACGDYIRTVLAHATQPHQTIVFGFVQLLFIEARVVVAKYWHDKLEDTLEVLKADLLIEYGETEDNNGVTVQGFSPADMEQWLAPLRSAIKREQCAKQTFNDYVPGKERAKKQFVDERIQVWKDQQTASKSAVTESAMKSALEQEWSQMSGDDKAHWCNKVSAEFMLSEARREFEDQRMKVWKDQQTAGKSTVTESAMKSTLEQEWSQMSSKCRGHWFDQVRANHIYRWVNNVSKKAPVKDACRRLVASRENDWRNS